MKKTVIIAAILTGILLLGHFGVQQLRPPISSNLSLLDEPGPAVVLAYENYSPAGGEALDRLKRIRPDYETRVHFIVADLGTPQGSAFANRYKLYDSQAVILTGKRQVAGIVGLETPDELFRQKLDAALDPSNQDTNQIRQGR